MHPVIPQSVVRGMHPSLSLCLTVYPIDSSADVISLIRSSTLPVVLLTMDSVSITELCVSLQNSVAISSVDHKCDFEMKCFI